jgi:2-polyprenyl-3-methyl-5-hydroxy-6-metoxy-1,4-benzoquinol methylase
MSRRSSGNEQKHRSSNPLQRRMIDRFHAEVIRLTHKASPSSVLDLGCGEGYVLEALVDAGIDAELTGIDRSSTAVADARRRLGERAQIIERDVTIADPTPQKYDLVMMLEVLEHLDDVDEALRLLAELTNVYVLVSVPREPFFRGLNLLRLKNIRRWGSDPEHIQHWSSGAFERRVSSSFNIEDRGHAFPWTMLLLTPKTGTVS